jgi:hypothetical protein
VFGTSCRAFPARLGQQENTEQDAQKGGLLTRPTPAATSPARPESAKTASSPKDALFPKQGRSERTTEL